MCSTSASPAVGPSARRVDGPRRELKIAIEGEDRAQAAVWVRLHPAAFRKSYPGRWVNSAYFDSPDLQNYRDNVAGIANRRKIRLRWYGDLGGGSTPVLELKIRKNGLGWKIRYSVDRPQNLLGRSWDEIVARVAGTVQPCDRPALEEDHLPVLVNRYYREYYRSAGGECDLTLDSGFRFFDQRLATRPNIVHPVPTFRAMVIELKFPVGGEASVREISSRFPFRLTKSSKYVIGVQAGLAVGV